MTVKQSFEFKGGKGYESRKVNRKVISVSTYRLPVLTKDRK